MKSMTIQITVFLLLLSLLISCSQKYDESGIFAPDDLNFTAVTCDSVTVEKTMSFPTNFVSDRFAYIGGEVNSGDTVTYAQISLRSKLPVLENLDSSFVVYKIDKSLTDSLVSPLSFSIEVLKMNSELPDTLRNDTDFSGTYFCSASITDNTADNSFELKFSLDKDSIAAWAAQDTLKTTSSFLLRSREGSDPFPVIKFYSASWSFSSVRPKLISYYSYLNDEDSLIHETRETPVSKDLTVGFKDPAPSPAPGDFVLGGFSGEGYLCKIDISSVPMNAIILNADIIFEETGTDPLYGGIGRTDKAYLLCYNLQDSLWQNGADQPATDSMLVNENTSYRKFINIDNFVHGWINDPSTYHGFMIKSKNWNSPLGWTSYKKPVVKIKYIIPE
jgi:hypothetical protein